MLWDNIKGQESAVRYLRQSIRRQKIAPAYLFSGPDGVGKGLAARVLAQALNCRRGEEGPCGECEPCLQIEKNSYPDLLRIGPRGKARQITIDSLREMQRIAHLAVREGGWKVIILEEAETLNVNAANSLLKTLEEPPERTVFLLLSGHPERLLPTIRSRCQAISFKPWSGELMRSFLSRRAGLTGDRASVLSRLAGGRPGRALRLNEKGFFLFRDRVQELLGELFSAAASVRGVKALLDEIKSRGREREAARPRPDRMEMDKVQLKEWQKEAEAVLEAEKLSDLDLIFELFYNWFRDLYVFRAAGRPEFMINADRVPAIKAAAARWSSRGLLKALSWVRAGREAVLGRGTTTSQAWLHRLILENLLIQIRNSGNG